jgi:hypothetical protein
MNAQLLTKLFGTDGRWCGGCTVILNAEANIQPISNDVIVTGGIKSFAPRLITGRIAADAVKLLPEMSTLLLIQKTVIRQQTGDDLIKRTLSIVDVNHVVAIEFAELDALDRLGVAAPK